MDKETLGMVSAFTLGNIVGLILHIIILGILGLSGCGGTPDLPPCGPGTYEFRGICLPTETEPPCGPGTYEVGGICIADPVTPPPPVKTLVCGEGTYIDPETDKCVSKCNDVIPYYADGDNDGYGNASFIVAYHCPGQKIDHQADNGDDCNDLDPNINPGIPGACPSTIPTECWADWDGDGYPSFHTPSGYIVVHTSDCPQGFAKRTQEEDCNDMNSGIHPGATEICGNGVDDNCDGVVDEGCTPLPSTLLVSASPDTPSSQTLMMGTTGVEIMQLYLDFSTYEDIVLDTVTIVDDGDSKAYGALKNLKLMSGTFQYASSSTLTPNCNKVASTTFGEFGGMGVKLIKGNYAFSLSVKVDVTAWDDGGSVSSHRLRVTQATATTKSGAKVAVSISTGANEPAGKWMVLVRAKLSIAWAADSPSGLAVPSQEQVVAKFVATNSANVGNYSLWMDKMSVAVGTIGMKLGAQNTLRLYRDSLSPSNLLATYGFDASAGNFMYNIPQIDVPHLEIASGTSRNILVTLDTANASLAVSGNAVSIQLPPESILWTDGIGMYGGLVDSLPLPPKTLVF